MGVYEELVERGLIAQVTNEDDLPGQGVYGKRYYLSTDEKYHRWSGDVEKIKSDIIAMLDKNKESQAANYVATAPKSNASICAIDDAMATVRETGNLPIPPHLQDAHYKSAHKLGHGIGYKYAHDYPNNYVEQQYMPYELNGKEFYSPSGNGYEVRIREHIRKLKEQAKGQIDEKS